MYYQKRQVITVFFSRSKDLSDEDLLALVASKNEDAHTRLWKILSSKEEGSGKLLTFAIDKQSIGDIKKGGNALFYCFGKGRRRKICC